MKSIMLLSPASLLALVLLLATGCASNITPAGPNTYYISKGPLPIWNSSAKAKADLYQQADQWCRRQSLVMVPVSSSDDPARFGHAGSAELTFRALHAGDTAITNTAPGTK